MIPDGWTYETLGNHIFVKHGFAFKSEYFYSDGQYVLLTPGSFHEKGGIRLIPEKLKYYIGSIPQEYILSRNDVLVVMTEQAPGLLGSAALIPESNKYLHNQRLGLIKINNSKIIDVNFIYCIFNSWLIRQPIEETASGTKVKHTSPSKIHEIIIPIPPLLEQCKIAEVLGVWDESIDLLERLIGRVRSRKQGLMQQLLTGKKRFKEFESSEWRTVQLIEVAEVIVSPVDKLTVEGEISVLLCNYTHVYHNIRITKALNFMRATATEKEIAKFTLLKGDVIITKDSETPNDIAVPSYVSEDLGNVVCGYHLSILRPRKNEIDGEYLSYLLSTAEIRYYFFTLANGATRFGLSVGSIEKAQFNLPSLPEQEKIAAVLSAADEEISTLEKQLAAYKQQKLGLMQQLLTGRIRI